VIGRQIRSASIIYQSYAVLCVLYAAFRINRIVYSGERHPTLFGCEREPSPRIRALEKGDVKKRKRKRPERSRRGRRSRTIRTNWLEIQLNIANLWRGHEEAQYPHPLRRPGSRVLLTRGLNLILNNLERYTLNIPVGSSIFGRWKVFNEKYLDSFAN